MKFSIITICYNAEYLIKQTLLSEISQKYNDFEIVIVDGKSTDKTLEIIQETVSFYDFPKERISIISEKDNGVYDAMNKGVRVASGEYLIFMNCGDSFYDNDVLLNFDKAISRGDNADVYYGNTLMVFYEGTGVFHDDENTPRNKVMPFIHQSAITRRECLIEHPYNLSYRICADFELYYWMRNNHKVFIHENFVVSRYDAKEGLSENNPLLIAREKDRIQGLDKHRNYWIKKIIQRCTIGLIQPIKDYAPRRLINKYLKSKKTYIDWL